MESRSGDTIFGYTGPVAKGLAVAVLMAGVTAFLFSMPDTPSAWPQSRDLVQKLFFFPLLLCAAWFGGAGAVIATAAVTLVSGWAIATSASGNPAGEIGRMGELGVFWLVGALSANFFEQQKTYVRDMEEANENTLMALASALDTREHGTGLHSQRVAEYTLRLAKEMKIADPAALADMWKGAILHDVGKIGIPDSVLLKAGPLSESEWEVMRRHPEVGNAMLRRFAFLGKPAEIVLCHHERYDGAGYPRGLAGEAIPLGSRLFAAVDVYDALTTARTYHASLSHARALEVLREGMGTHFDPAVVEAFERVPLAEWTAIARKFEQAG